MGKQIFIENVKIKNFKSIGACNVDLHNLTFLVGPNGAGKSNFLDALRFIRDSLKTTVENALHDRGGINEVRRRSNGHPNNFGIRIEFTLPSKKKGHYAFLIGAKQGGGFEIKKEECEIIENGVPHHYTIESNKIINTSLSSPIPPMKDRLYLLNASNNVEFRELYDSLSTMGFYNLNPNSMSKLQPPEEGSVLSGDGKNVASVIHNLSRHRPRIKSLVENYLKKVVKSVHRVDRKPLGPMETLEFKQDVAGSKNPWNFLATNMSDGTLRTLGVLVAIFQKSIVEMGSSESAIPLTGIEEPETALHPAAAGVLRAALLDAARHKQIIVTSHSPDLLDDPAITDENILSVISIENETFIDKINESSKQALNEHLMTAGELLRLNQLEPNHPEIFGTSQGRQPRLF